MGKTSTAVKDRWNKKAYDRLEIRVKKGIKEEFREACENAGCTMNGAVNKFIEDFIKKNGEKQ